MTAKNIRYDRFGDSPDDNSFESLTTDEEDYSEESEDDDEDLTQDISPSIELFEELD